MNAPPDQAAQRIEAVVFDLDDTLYPERQYVRSGYRAVERRLGQWYPNLEGAADWMWSRFERGERDRMFDSLAEHWQVDLSPHAVRELVDCYRRHRPKIEADREMLDVLRLLRPQVRLGLLTDGYLPAQQYKLEALGLADAFDAVVFTEAMGRNCWKPSSVGFERIARELDAAHRACAYVADNPAKDFVAPNALGWLTVQIRRAGQVHADNPAPPGGRPRYVVRDASSLLAALGQGDP